MAKRKVGGVLITPVKKARTGAVRRRGRARRGLNLRTAGFLGIERHFSNFESNSDAFTTSWATMQDGTIKCVSAIAVGNTEKTRQGRVYHISSIHMRGDVRFTSTEGSIVPLDTVMCRVVLVQDTQTNAAELTATDVFDASQATDYLAFRNLQQTKRFRILMDKVITLDATGQTNEGAANLFATGVVIRHFKFNRTFKTPIKVICKGSTAVIGSIVDNSIHVIGISSSIVGTPLLTYQVRIRFTP